MTAANIPSQTSSSSRERRPEIVRVLQLVQKPQRRGAEVFTFELCRWLESQGHVTKTVYLYPHEGDTTLELAGDDEVLDGAERSRLERLPGVHPRLLARLARTLRSFRPDVVQVNGARTIKYGAALARLAPRRRWPLVYRNIDSPRFWVRGLLRIGYYRHIVMPRVDGVVGVSRRTLEEVLAFYGLACPAVFVPNGVDLAKLSPETPPERVRDAQGTPKDAIVALFVGHLGAQKRPDRFVRVFAEAARAEPRLRGWLLGDGPARKSAEQLARELGVRDQLRFLGYRRDVGDLIAAADFLLSTSDTEGIPAVVIEAGCLGKPTVGPRVGGMHEVVLNGKTGLLVPAGDEAALVRATLTLASDEARCRALGDDARTWCRDTFGMHAVGPRYAAFYERLREERA